VKTNTRDTIIVIVILLVLAAAASAAEPSWSWPGYPSEKALGSYLMQKNPSYYTSARMSKWTFRQWREVHDKIQNKARTKGYVQQHTPGWGGGNCGRASCTMCYGSTQLIAGWDTSLRQVAPPKKPPPRKAAPKQPPAGAITLVLKPMRPDPNAPTPQHVVEEALKLAETKETDYVVDLGSGDGRVVITAAKTYGCEAVGVERIAELVNKARKNAQDAGVKNVQFLNMNFTDLEDLSRATVVYMYLYPHFMKSFLVTARLRTLKPGTRIVTYMHEIPGIPADKQLTINGNGEQYVLFLYTVTQDTFKFVPIK